MKNLQASMLQANFIFAHIFWGSLIGFEIAWASMKINWIDMRFNTGLFFLLGMAVGLVLALSKGKLKSRLSVHPFIIFVPVFVLSGYVLVSMAGNPHAAIIVGPILIREGLNLREIQLDFIQKIVLWYLVFGFLSSIAFLYGKSSNSTYEK